MIVFHGTTEIMEKPDVLHSKSYLDFGKGFYLTTYQEQAEREKELLTFQNAYEVK